MKRGAAALLGVPLAASGVRSAERPKFLPKVDMSANRIVRQVAGLRPFRPSGFVLRADRFGDKVVIHNYGHGGCGVTLSWGTADMASRLALETPHRQAAVIGCGAVGLATARLLQDRGFDVTIYARDIPPNTTSDIAAALFGVTSLVGSSYRYTEIVALISQAVRFAHRYFQNFVGERYGIRWIEFFMIGAQPQDLPWEFSITPDLFPLTPYQSGDNPFRTAYAASFPTLSIETNIYLPQLIADFLQRGGKLRIQEFPDRSALRLEEPVIFNCTGLGARTLFGDNELIPIKGQLTLLQPQRELNYAYLDGANDLYMFPRRDAVILGGSHQERIWTTDPDDARAARIWDGHRRIAANMR